MASTSGSDFTRDGGSTSGQPSPEQPHTGVAPDPYGQPDYSQVQPDYGQPYGEMPQKLAGFWIRFAGALIDGIIIGVAQFILGLILDTTVAQGLGFLISAAYFTYFHGTTGQTLGNKAVNIQVVDAAGGGTIDYGRAFLRWIVSFVSGIVVALGYLWMLWDPQNQTWHDKAARTLVIRSS